MAVNTSQSDRTHFLVKRGQLNTSKIFVEFYLPEYQEKFDALTKAPYPLKPLKKIASRLFDGPFGSNQKVAGLFHSQFRRFVHLCKCAVSGFRDFNLRSPKLPKFVV